MTDGSVVILAEMVGDQISFMYHAFSFWFCVTACCGSTVRMVACAINSSGHYSTDDLKVNRQISFFEFNNGLLGIVFRYLVIN